MARIARKQIENELSRIEEVLNAHASGLLQEEIGNAYARTFGESIAAHTLRRRIAILETRGRIRDDGKSRDRRYYAPSNAPDFLPSRAADGVSSEGRKLRANVVRPLDQRTPVGYDIDWLRAYEPGKTAYLTPAVREHLGHVGRVSAEERAIGTFGRDILDRLLIDLAWASSRLEGNTYSLLDTENLIEFGQTAEGKDAAETQMILNHKRAIGYVVEQAEFPGISAHVIKTVHALLAENLVGDAAAEGALRRKPVTISSSAYLPTAVPQLIEEAFARIVGHLTHIDDPFERAFFALVHLPYLQPFVDVNKRTSRLVANIPLLHANLCPLSFIGANEDDYVCGTLAVYELRRVELLRDFFVTAYERSAKQYTIVRESIPAPDPIRLRYRDAISAAVQDVIHAGAAPNRSWLRARAAQLGIEGADGVAFVDAALNVLLGLNGSSAARCGLTEAAFLAWRSRFQQ